MTDREYTTKIKMETFLGQTISVSVTDYIASAQSYIEVFTGRIFAPDDEETVKTIDGNGKDLMYIPDASEVSKVEIATDDFGDTFKEIDSDDYKVIEDNNSQYVKQIYLRNNIFHRGIRNVRITGKFGWKETPADIRFCATVLASGMYNAKAGVGDMKSESIGQYSVSYDDKDWGSLEKVKTILQSYQNIII